MNLLLGKKTRVQIFVPLKNFLDLFSFETYLVKKIDYILNDLVEKGELDDNGRIENSSYDLNKVWEAVGWSVPLLPSS